MLMVVVSALPLSVLVDSVFLALIAVFSAYLTAAGWRFAKNRAGRLSAVDWAIPIVMAVASVVMIGLGVQTLAANGVVLVAFGVVGAGLSMLHLRRLRTAPVRGRVRIASHLLWMLSAAIAAVTAFLVVNGPFGLVDWFLPTIVIVPLIVVWRRKVMAGAQTTASRAAVGPPG